jgi:twitching motility protein PilT
MSQEKEIAPATALASQIPAHLVGEARHRFIRDLIDRQSDEIKIALKRQLDALLVQMRQLEASDLEIGGAGTQGQVWLRVHGKKTPHPELGTYTLDETDVLVNNILIDRELETLLQRKFLDFSYRVRYDSGKSSWARFRATVYFELQHLALNMRMISDEIRPFKDLGLHAEVAKALSLKQVRAGLVLITGVTGSGKSSTLDTIIDANNRAVDGHILIIAEPIEYLHVSRRCIVKQREVGRDVLSFKDGTYQALRQDPDMVVIGEMRDAETMMTVLQIAESGHKVFSTLLTNSATESVERILSEVPSSEQDRVRTRLADLLTCVISQKLVPSLDGKRVLAKEVMLSTPAVRAAIRNDNTSEIYQIIHQSSHLGMVTMEQDLVNLCKARRISYTEAYNFANNKKRFEELAHYEGLR